MADDTELTEQLEASGVTAEEFQTALATERTAYEERKAELKEQLEAGEITEEEHRDTLMEAALDTRQRAIGRAVRTRESRASRWDRMLKDMERNGRLYGDVYRWVDVEGERRLFMTSPEYGGRWVPVL